MEHWVVYTDGGSRGNPGPAAIGGIVTSSERGELYSFSQCIGTKTNNEAEYQAVVHVCEWLTSQDLNQVEKIAFYLDSKLVVEQLSGNWKIKEERLRSYVTKIRNLLSTQPISTSFHHVPRAKNTQADSLVNQALDAAQE